MAEHTFLLTEAYWKAQGKFWDENNNEYPVNGETLIKHLESKWIKKAVLRIYAARSINFSNAYEIQPFAAGQNTTLWVSENPSMGSLFGTFTLTPDELISEYRSKDNKYRGVESFAYQSDDCYQVEGSLFKNEVKISSWTVMLQRQSQGQIH